MNYDKNTEKLKNFLLELSLLNNELFGENKEEVKEKAREIEGIYSGDFRHSYSDIFSTITEIYNKENCNEAILLSNLKVLKKYIDKEKAETEISRKFLKLYDHVNLDVSRLVYTNKIVSKIDRDKKDIWDEVNRRCTELEENLEKAQNKHAHFEEELRNAHKSYVTILGIFASIVLTFVAGISFSSSVLQNINAVSVYRLTAVCILIAATLINIIYMLLSFINIQILSGSKRFLNIKIVNITIAGGSFALFIFWIFNKYYWR